MVDLSQFIAPKSDQLNADDLIGGSRTVTVTRVKGEASDKDQPISIFFEGDNSKPFKPCKSMRRVLVEVWGKDGREYAGRSMTLYRDPEVTFGGIKVGGIRISHMSHIDRSKTVMLTITRARRKPMEIKPLEVAAPPKSEPVKQEKPADAPYDADHERNHILGWIERAERTDNLNTIKAHARYKELLRQDPFAAEIVSDALEAKRHYLETAGEPATALDGG